MELRWVLLGLGLLVILGVYIWGAGIFRVRRKAAPELTKRAEPSIEPEQPEPPKTPKNDKSFETAVIERKPSPRRLPDKVVAIRLVPRDGPLIGDKTVLALRKCGLEHGQYGIFHKIVNGDAHNPMFSVASLTEPGSFDLTRLAESEIAGLSVFLALPGEGDPVERFDAMIEAARSLVRELDVDICDEKGSSWSVQRERFIREEMIQYRHHLKHG